MSRNRVAYSRGMDSSLVVEITAPADASREEISEAIDQLTKMIDGMHRALGGHGITIRRIIEIDSKAEVSDHLADSDDPTFEVTG